MQLSPPMMLFWCSIYKQATSADDWSTINTAYCIASERKQVSAMYRWCDVIIQHVGRTFIGSLTVFNI